MLPEEAAGTPPDLAIFENDRNFPFIRSPFRRVEYAAYLRSFPGAVIYSTYANCPGTDRTCPEYAEVAPHIQPLGGALDRPFPRLAYTVFLPNTSYFLPFFERHGIPFCFTLYPGGCFLLDELGSDLRLMRILSSPCFRKVIVTQRLTQSYLLEHGLCRPDQIEFIWGCVLPVAELSQAAIPRKYYPRDKATFDIGFVAFKYSDGGRDKGFDVFADSAAQLASVLPSARFHVVGNFTPGDLPEHAPREKMTFYGPQPTSFFPAFYSGIDLVLAPTRPFVLAPGAFDGFPTGASMEAAACGVPVFCSDPLRLNECFQNEKELVIIEPDSASACAAILRYHRDPIALQRLGENGRQAVLRLFHPDAQLAPRIRLLNGVLASEAGRPARIAPNERTFPWLEGEYQRLSRFEKQLRNSAGACGRCHEIEASRGWKLVLRLRRLKQFCRALLRAA